MPDLGAINNVYRGALDADAGHGVSPAAAYAHLISIGANPNEALFLVSGAASESRLNPNAVHDEGRGYGLFGHNGSRLLALHQYAQQTGGDLSDWRTQFGFGLQELRSRPEGRAVANATSPEQLGMAQMYFERPQGFTPDNPEAGHNYTGRVNQIRYFTQLDPHASGLFAPSANPQITPQQMASAAPAGLGNLVSSEDALRQKLADLEAQMRSSDSHSRPPPLISQLLGMAVNPIRDAVSNGLTALLAGGETAAGPGPVMSPQSAAPMASGASPAAPARLAPPAFPASAPAAQPVPMPPPAGTSSLGSPFAAPGLPAPQQPTSASIAPSLPLPTFAQGSSGLDRLASLFGTGVTKPPPGVL